MLKAGHYFENQPRDEKIIMVKRRHWLAYFSQVLFLTILIIVPSVIVFLIINANLFNLREFILESYVNIAYFIVGASCYLLIIMILFIYSWAKYYLNIVIITSDHLVDIKQIDLFHRKVSEQSLLRVQDVSSKMQGFLQTFFKVGTVYVETAGEAPNFVMPSIHKPYEVSNAIMTYHERMSHGENQNKGMATAEGEIATQNSEFDEVGFGADKEPKKTKKKDIKTNEINNIEIMPISDKIENPQKPNYLKKKPKESIIDLPESIPQKNNTESKDDEVDKSEIDISNQHKKVSSVKKKVKNNEGEIKDGEEIEF